MTRSGCVTPIRLRDSDQAAAGERHWQCRLQWQCTVISHIFNVVFNNTHSLLWNAQRSSKPRHACCAAEHTIQMSKRRGLGQLATSLSAPSHAGCRTNLPFLCCLFALAWCDVPVKSPRTALLRLSTVRRGCTQTVNWRRIRIRFIFWIG